MSDAASGKRDTIHHDGEVFELRFERIFTHPIERVWAAITQPGVIAEWLAPAEIDPRPGGRIRLAFTTSDSVVDSMISEIDPPRVLEYRWVSNGDDRGVVRWELADLGDRTRLLLTHAYTGKDLASFMAGWKSHLLQLDAALDEAPIPFPWPFWRAEKAAFEVGQG